MEPEQLCKLIHTLAANEIWFERALNEGRGTKSSSAAMEKSRLEVFKACLGRDPSDTERHYLLFGDS